MNNQKNVVMPLDVWQQIEKVAGGCNLSKKAGTPVISIDHLKRALKRQPIKFMGNKEFQTKYKFIHMKKSPEKYEGRDMWQIVNNKANDELGIIVYYKPWKQYCFSQTEERAIFNTNCLFDIIDFLNQLNS